MEAKRNFTKDTIEVSATPEEWRKVIDNLSQVFHMVGESEELVNWLIDQGAYEA